MCNQDCIDWVARNLTRPEVQGKRVLEVGSRDVNGSIRPAIESLNPREYIGIDIRHGPGVDKICAAEEMADQFGKLRFDLVATTCTLEHIRHWQKAISNIKQVCSPDGLILIIVPSRWPYHAFPDDYWRFSAADIRVIFSDCQILSLEEDKGSMTLVYAKIRKPAPFLELDLSSYPLYSMIAHRRTPRFRTRYFFSPAYLAFALRNRIGAHASALWMQLRGKFAVG